MQTQETNWQTFDVLRRQRLLGDVVRESIIDAGQTYTATAAQWSMSRGTLNRLMRQGDVGVRIMRQVERELHYPFGLLQLLLLGDVDAIEELPGLSPVVRERVINGLRTIGDAPDEGPLRHQMSRLYLSDQSSGEVGGNTNGVG